jgi:thioredoxin 1
VDNILHVQKDQWSALESSAKPVFVDFWAEWCAPCRMLGPTFEKLAQKYGNEVTFAKVNVDELPELAAKLGIRSIPTLLLLRDGKVIEQLAGTRSYDDLERVLERHVKAVGTSAA